LIFEVLQRFKFFTACGELQRSGADFQSARRFPIGVSRAQARAPSESFQTPRQAVLETRPQEEFLPHIIGCGFAVRVLQTL
jgi:hypothetical protein